jgi:hypothetical protein
VFPPRKDESTDTKDFIRVQERVIEELQQQQEVAKGQQEDAAREQQRLQTALVQQQEERYCTKSKRREGQVKV